MQRSINNCSYFQGYRTMSVTTFLHVETIVHDELCNSLYVLGLHAAASIICSLPFVGLNFCGFCRSATIREYFTP